jgi:hypothetical protein
MQNFVQNLKKYRIMAEQIITIEIDENGKIKAETEGIKGEMCLDELQKLLEDFGELQSVNKTDEFYQNQTINVNNKIQNKKL